MNYWDRPCAAKGLTSYRYPTISGSWIMIGATDDKDAIREANRSLDVPNASLDKLQKWNGTEYRNVP